MTVRSARLAAATGTTGAQVVLYTCPAGRTALIKDLVVSSPVGTVTRCVVAVNSGGQQVSLLDAQLGTGVITLAGRFIVLEPGDELKVYSEGAVARVWASGAELDGTAP